MLDEGKVEPCKVARLNLPKFIKAFQFFINVQFEEHSNHQENN